MSGLLQSFVIDPLLVALFFLFAISGARVLLFLFHASGRTSFTALQAPAHKLATLESLRGILAFSVVAHHAWCWYFLPRTGVWATGNGVLFARLATFGVAQFFYLSGFLFWRKLMKAGGIPFGRFYLSRLIRIAPVYYVTLALSVLLGLALIGYRFNAAPGAWARSSLPWLLFTLGGVPSVGQVDLALITAGVSWTLGLEWLFYLTLPFLAWFSRRARRLAYLAVIFGLLHWLGGHIHFGQFATRGALQSASSIVKAYAKFMLIGFGGGMLIAALESRIRQVSRFLHKGQNWLLLSLYLAYLLVPGIAAPGQILLLAGFALVVQGTDLFGLLSSPAVRFLGLISYPTYLVHGMVLYAAMHAYAGQPLPAAPFMLIVALCLAAVLLLASLIHLLIERPTMRLSEKIARRASLPVIQSPS